MRLTIDDQGDDERLARPFHAVLTIRSSDPVAQTFVATCHVEGRAGLDTYSFRYSDLAEGVEPVVGKGYRSVGTLGNMQIRPFTKEDESELFPKETPAEVEKALASLRRLARLVKNPDKVPEIS